MKTCNGCHNRLWDVLRHLSFILHERPFCGPGNLFYFVRTNLLYIPLFPFLLFSVRLYNPDRKPSIVSANFDCRLSVRSRTSLFAGEKSSSPSPLASVFFAASLFLDWSPILGQKNKQPSGTGLYQRGKIKLKIEAL